MDRALSMGRGTAPAAIPLILGALPALMVLHDGLTRANPNDALWAMPLPVAAALLLLAGLAARGADLDALRPRDALGRVLGLGGVALGILAFALLAIRAEVPAYGAIRLGELTLVAAVTVALAAAFRTSGEGLARAAALALVFGIAAGLPLVAAARWAGWPAGYSPLDVPGFIHIRIMGFSIALALAAAAGLWSETRAKPLLFAAMAAMATALFWSGGRGALAGLVLPLPVLALILPALRPGLLPLAVALVFGAGAAWFLETGVAQLGIGGRLADLGGSADALTSGRITMWQTLLEAMAEAPLLGHGAAQTHWIFADAGHAVAHVHAHNLVLDTALALGWPGAVVAAGLVLVLWLRSVLQARTSGSALEAAAVALFSTFLALSLVDGVYVYWPGLLPLAVALAILTAAPRGPDSRPGQGATVR